VADTIALDLARVYRSSAYDTSGRPMAGAFGVGSTFNYDSYLVVGAADDNGVRQRIELYLPSGSRDAEHRVTQITYQVNDEAPRTFSYGYDPLGRRIQATLANGITVTYAWDAASQLTGVTYRRADGSVLGDLTYGYDLAGRRTKSSGSLAKVDLPQAVSDAQYNAANQLMRWAGKALVYDLNGNLANDGVSQYSWNEQGLLGQINGGVTASFSYDVFNRRKDRTVNGRRMQTVWIGDELNFMVPDGDWSQRIRVFSPYPESGLDELTFRRIGDDASQDRYVLRDANNNVIALTDANQQSQTQYGYEPYGKATQAGAADPNPQQYTGRENDGTGLYYYRNRYYSPQTGRFISEDPLGWASGQTNAYAYVGGNPVQLTDPSGLQMAFPIPVGPMPGGGAGPSTPSWVSPPWGAQGVSDWIRDHVGGIFSNGDVDDPVVYPDNPDSAKDGFTPIRGTPGRQCDADGSVWEKDTAGHGNRDGDGSQWKRWPNRKAWEKGRTPQSIWPDGRIRK
jgi:RHS repeat-associated protein